LNPKLTHWEMKTKFCVVFLGVVILSCHNRTNDQPWPQFRGLNGSGVASELSKPPIRFEKNKLDWKIDMPPGSSSPVVWDEKLILTAYIENIKELQTICVNREDGKILWHASVIPDTLESYHPISSPAQGTVTTDGERIVAFFGSCGMFCYDMNGVLQWKHPMPCNKDGFGNGASPVIYQDKVIFLHDHWQDRYLLALDKKTGALLWKTTLADLSLPTMGSHSIPVFADTLIFIHRPGEIACFSVTDGSQIWNFRIITQGATSPIIAGDRLVTACWFTFSEVDQRGELPGFDDLIKKYDKNKNLSISQAEAPDDILFSIRPETHELTGANHSVKDFFWAFDSNSDKEITGKEWQEGQDVLKNYYYKPAGLIAFKLNGKGQLTEKDIQWRVNENTPEVPSPIFYNNRIYMVKDGGALSCVDSETGRVIYQKRIGNPGPQMASPVAANGYLYIFAYNGKLKVVKAGDVFEIASEYDFKDNITATPAIVGNTIYIRTRKELLAYTN
jgi:outer membrane protein assembly factor BamB